jgi:ankyrin repeat protein
LGVFDALLNARGIDLEAKARNGDTALMIASFKANLPAVKALIDKGAEVNKTGWTPLHYAASIGNNDIVSLLLEKSAYIDAESPNKTTPIMMAARAGHIMTVKLLLDEGADATLKNDAGMTAIDFAEKHEFRDIAEGLTYRLKKAGKL